MNLRSRLRKLEAMFPPETPVPLVVDVLVKDQREAELARRLEDAIGGPVPALELPDTLFETSAEGGLTFKELWSAVPLALRRKVQAARKA